MPEAVSERFPGGEWLDPLARRLGHAFQLLDVARLALATVATAVVLLYVGAKLEREMLKRRLEVVDGEEPREEVASGDRG